MGFRQPKKDWRKRTWPSGTNVKGMKSEAARKFRRKLKQNEFEEDGKTYKKHFCHYDINDFK